jgi:hypothetical protein
MPLIRNSCAAISRLVIPCGADGHHVRLLVRDIERARTQLSSDFEYVEGSVTDT